MTRWVGILCKHDKPEAVQIAGRLGDWLRARGEEAFAVGSSGPGLTTIDEHRLGELALLVVLGGDGTILRGAALVAQHGVPILGVNLGHLGFLASCAPADAQAAVEKALSGQLAVEERMRLRCVVRRTNGETVERMACNDAVVSQGALARLIELEAWLGTGADSALINRYRSDGLIVSTPTGSTAYNLAAGGPIVTPDVRAMVVTPICPHGLTNRPLVTRADLSIRIRLGQPAEHVTVTIDGQWGTQLGWNDELEISEVNPPLRLHRSADSYFEVLRQKLRWGERAS